MQTHKAKALSYIIHSAGFAGYGRKINRHHLGHHVRGAEPTSTIIEGHMHKENYFLSQSILGIFAQLLKRVTNRVT